MNIKICLPEFGNEFIGEIEKFGKIRKFENNEDIINQGQLISYLPIVLNGLVKVQSQENGIQFLLYYLKEGSACIFSFAHLFSPRASDFSAVSVGETEMLLIPMDKAKDWLIRFPVFNTLILNEYQKHYDDLLQTTKQIICYKLEERLLSYLKNKSKFHNSKEFLISHRSIADDLGTTREVISRIMKKIEGDGKIKQQNRKIFLIV
ncbi:CRP/FNR family transcriptional regulator [Flavobacterium sp. 90]|uniref:Crp/Fnr family transcriptional regulator n=1 Tax=unclassified Flavobacterium TaxID=196869 RepID=UPI000EAF2A21|nr:MULTISPECIES: Crp/Fnr family transcriptional regulator [unclassified Flavobacterium]RKR08950.1 CRP/FNR family transcriptional regulator [Flavobacterium sp. 81]TCK52738.1 CRP/FNR family transcriptional regulator [Flavobacterium sp. 90]